MHVFWFRNLSRRQFSRPQSMRVCAGRKWSQVFYADVAAVISGVKNIADTLQKYCYDYWQRRQQQ